LIAFQKKYGLKISGTLDKATTEKLYVLYPGK